MIPTIILIFLNCLKHYRRLPSKSLVLLSNPIMVATSESKNRVQIRTMIASVWPLILPVLPSLSRCWRKRIISASTARLRGYARSGHMWSSCRPSPRCNSNVSCNILSYFSCITSRLMAVDLRQYHRSEQVT